MRFPDSLSVKISSNDAPVPGVLVRVTIFMQRKNNYYITFGPTDVTGECSISRDEMLLECEIQLTYGIMDYYGAEEGNTGTMRVAVVTPEQVSDEQRVHALGRGETSAWQQRYYDYLEHSKEVVERIGLHQIRVDANCIGGEMVLVS